MEELTVRINNRNTHAFMNEIKKINETFARFNFPNTVYEVVDADSDDNSKVYRVYSEFESPNLAGEIVHFRGSINLLKVGDEKTRVLNIMDETISHIMQTEHCVCDRCRKNIARGTYYVFSKDVKEVKSRDDFYVLGTTCAKVYFPFNIEDYLKRYSSGLVTLARYDEDTMGYNSVNGNFAHIDMIAESVNLATNGCTSVYNKDSTLSKIEMIYSDLMTKTSKCKEEIEHIRNEVTVSFDNNETIQNAIKYFNLHHTSDFDFNCHQVLENVKNSNGEINLRYLRMVACALYFGNKKLKKEEKFTQSEYIGNIGDKFTGWKLTFKGMISFESRYGFTNMIKFLDGNHNVIIWYTQKSTKEINNGVELSDGDMITLKGTIKDHKVYGLEKQTLITRCNKIA